MAFLLDVHIAQRVTDRRMNLSCVSVSRRLKSQLFALSSVVAAKLTPSSSSTRAHVHLETVQSSSECCNESGAPQKPQVHEVDIFRCALTFSVGNDCLDSLHRNMRTLDGTSVFHRAFHAPLFARIFDIPADPSNHASLLFLVVTSML